MDIKRSNILIQLLCFLALITALLFPAGTVAPAAALVCLLAACVVLYRNMAGLSNVSENNPKVRTLKGVTVFTMIYCAVVGALVIGAEKGAFDGLLERLAELSERQREALCKLGMAVLLAVPMAVYGNAAPKLPFNRYTGLRLPWTVRDEETWVVAHRLLGYSSVPLVILLFVAVPGEMPLKSYAEFWWTGALLLWVAIPGALSGIFYWKKFHAKR